MAELKFWGLIILIILVARFLGWVGEEFFYGIKFLFEGIVSYIQTQNQYAIILVTALFLDIIIIFILLLQHKNFQKKSNNYNYIKKFNYDKRLK